jgi:O-antigen ligase
VRAARAIRTFVAVMAALLAVAIGISVVLGLTIGGSSRDGGSAVEDALSSRRPALWHDALVLIREHPINGVGPERFQLESPIARSDPDARWAHDEFLQEGAEQGVVGGALLILLFGWGFLRLSLAAVPDRVTALAATSLAALGIQSSIDYVMHFPALPLVVAALVGAASASSVKAANLQETHEHRYVRA